MQNDSRNILPGARVKVFDPRLYKNDVITPLSMTMQPATVVCRYGEIAKRYPMSDMTLGPYPDLVDVVFDYDGKLSKGHFTDGVEDL